MNWAPPAPWTEPAVAEPPQPVEPAEALDAPACEAAEATPPPPVEPASALDPAWRRTEAVSPMSVQALRSTGVEFESYAGVLQLHHWSMRSCLRVVLPCVPIDRPSISYGEVKKYVLVKDGICLIYTEQHDPKPLYALVLSDMQVLVEDGTRPFAGSVSMDPVPPRHCNNPNVTTVLLKQRTEGPSHVYQLSFRRDEAGQDAAKRFLDAVERAPPVLTAVASTILRRAGEKDHQSDKTHA